MITVLSPSPALDVTYLLDDLAIGGIHRPREVLRLAGGKGMNVARAGAVLGAGVRVVAPLGGHIGALVAELAQREGLDLQVVDVARETRMCVSALTDDGAPTEIYEHAAVLDERDAARLAAARGTGWNVLAGRLPDGFGFTRRDDERIAIDSSGPGLPALIDDLRPDLLKVNVHEARELLGRDDSALELARALRARTGGAVVLTAGAEGAVGVDADGAWRAVPDPQPGRYAIGSGDSFLAGLLAGLERGAALPDALRTASAAGSANTRVPGAAVFTETEFDAAHARIEVRPV